MKPWPPRYDWNAMSLESTADAQGSMREFYVDSECCMACGVPQAVAPDLVGWTDESTTFCYWIKQPHTADEIDRAVRVLNSQELGCHRYSGTDPQILRRLDPEDCDYFRPDLRFRGNQTQAKQIQLLPGGARDFELLASATPNLFVRLWRRLFHRLK